MADQGEKAKLLFKDLVVAVPGNRAKSNGICLVGEAWYNKTVLVCSPGEIFPVL